MTKSIKNKTDISDEYYYFVGDLERFTFNTFMKIRLLSAQK